MCSMKCTIPGVNLKVFGRAIQSLSKIGDELYFEPLEDGLYLRAVNMCRSAYGCFQFFPNFFSNYIDSLPDKNRNSDDGEALLRCKLGMKSILTVFKSLPTIDKTVEKCRIALDPTEARLVFQMYCRHGIIKTHKLAFTECETLQAVFSKDLCPNKLTAVPKLLCDAVLNFQNNQEEITLIIRPDFMALKNYVDDEADPHKVIHTELTLSPEEFEQYQAGVDADVTFCLRELRAVLAFADITSLPLTLQFETAGRPITLSITSDQSFEANFVLATLAEVEASEPSAAAGAQESSLRKSGSHERFRNTRKQNGKSSVNRNSSNNTYTEKQQSSKPEHSLHHSATVRDRPGTSHAADDMMNDDEDFSVMMDVTAPEEPYTSQPPTTVPEKNTRGTEQPVRKKVIFRHDTDDEDDEDGWHLNARAAENFINAAGSVSSEDRHAKILSSKEKDVNRVATVVQDHSKQIQTSSEAAQTSSGSSSTGGVHNVGRTFLSLKSGSGDTSPVVPMQNTNLQSESDESDNEVEEEIPATPPMKKFRSLFFGTQSSTQSTQSQQKSVILAPDSDEEH
ncbi:unnamed protein product [Candidula unifasciata]|uniref:Cell cycle checkpoint control protein RAD9A n=1 Tax=Candidula unifasciata TaxID=100452 RepID=A0A8S3YNZ8_9EUPU|nr:unnamed protein product [Candidula unifasciata]